MNTFNHQPLIIKRILAGLIDYTLIYGFSFAYLFSFGSPDQDGGFTITGLPALIPILIWFLITVGCESGLGGTIGNSVLGLQAIPENGRNRKLLVSESLKRHLLDPADMFLFGLVGIITIKNTDKHQRVGDIWAKTIVVPVKSFETKVSDKR
ncbi:RDD family protein [Leeuwenhoekiella marinoflava]|uniref:RDD family protein n=1 Tax=Leeuwenhoekiella marinoflava TaxID=988 RepID=UPI0030011E26